MFFSEAPNSQDPMYQVSDITRNIKRFLEDRFGDVWIEGELSNLRRPASGHLYFTLKDETAQIRAVCFRGNQRGNSVVFQDGMNVRVFGTVTMYEKSGDCQVNVLLMEAAGSGTLQERFERLKKKLFGEGLFNEARKKRLPLLPRHVGVVTSPSGAAIRDVLNVITRRFPNLHLLIVPVRVQGDGAAAEIAQGIDWLNRRGGMDVIIVTRGGGSLEDLWCFNEECVARAIARSVIPVISAVGHEIDFTISDFVADLRAPTPSAAAELVVGRKDEFERQLLHLKNTMYRDKEGLLQKYRNRLDAVRSSYVLRNPLRMLRVCQQEADQLRMRAVQSMQIALVKNHKRVELLKGNPCFQQPERMVTHLRHRMQNDVRRMESIMHLTTERADVIVSRKRVELAHMVQMRLEQQKNRADQWRMRLNSVDPDHVLQRGYTITCSSSGKIIVSKEQASAVRELMTRWRDGVLFSTVRVNKDDQV